MATSASLNSNFTSYGMTAAAIVASGDLREDVLHARIMADSFRFTATETLKGIVSESVAGVLTLGAVSQLVQKQKFAEQSEKLSKQRTQDAFFLALLRSGELDNWVADQIASDMTLADFEALDAQLLEETGMSFLEHASNILGPEAMQRLPGETDLEYQQRIMREVADEVLEDDLSVRPGFESNPLAIWIADHDFVEQAKEKALQADALEKEQGLEAAIEFVTPEIEAGYTQAQQVGSTVEAETLAEVSYDGVDAHRDDGFATSDAATARSAGFMAGFPGGGSALESASVDFGKQFVTAAENRPEAQKEPAPEIDPSIKLG